MSSTPFLSIGGKKLPPKRADRLPLLVAPQTEYHTDFQKATVFVVFPIIRSFGADFSCKWQTV